MNRLALTATLAFSLTAGFASAQNPSGPPPDSQFPHRHQHNPQMEAQHLARRLNLSPDQTARLEPILAEQQQRLRALHQSENSITAAQMFEQRRQIMQSTRQQLAGVLTPEQLQEMHHMRGARGGWGHRPDGPQGQPNGGQPEA